MAPWCGAACALLLVGLPLAVLAAGASTYTYAARGLACEERACVAPPGRPPGAPCEVAGTACTAPAAAPDGGGNRTVSLAVGTCRLDCEAYRAYVVQSRYLQTRIC